MKGTSPGSTARFLPQSFAPFASPASSLLVCFFVVIVVVVFIAVVGHVPLRSINLYAEPANIQDRIFFPELNYKRIDSNACYFLRVPF